MWASLYLKSIWKNHVISKCSLACSKLIDTEAPVAHSLQQRIGAARADLEALRARHARVLQDRQASQERSAQLQSRLDDLTMTTSKTNEEIDHLQAKIVPSPEQLRKVGTSKSNSANSL